MKLHRITEFTPGFDRRHADPNKNYGIHGGKFFFIVKGPIGAVHFVLGATFYPKSAQEHLQRVSPGIFQEPLGWDVGYHALAPQFQNQTISQDHCRWLDDKPCYSDGSAIRANEWTTEFLEKGTDWLWLALETEYQERFGRPKEKPASDEPAG